MKEAKQDSELRWDYMMMSMWEQDKFEAGRAEGVFQTLVTLVKDGLISLKDAATRANMPENVFSAKMASLLAQ